LAVAGARVAPLVLERAVVREPLDVAAVVGDGRQTGYRWRFPYAETAIEAMRSRLDPAHLAEGGTHVRRSGARERSS